LKKPLVVIRGAGDLATGVAQRLWRAGFGLLLLEQELPTVVRRTVSLASACYCGQVQVEDLCGVLVKDRLPTDSKDAWAFLHSYWSAGQIPLIIDATTHTIEALKPQVVVDAIMAKQATGTHRGLAPRVVALGPGFTAGVDVHAVVETNRGHHLGRVLLAGSAEANTGCPAPVAGASWQRLLRAPRDGEWWPEKSIGDLVACGERVGLVCRDGVHQEVLAAWAGRIRGLLFPRLWVAAGQKIGDIDPSASYEDCFTISDKARAIGGGVLEAVMWLGQLEEREESSRS